MKAIDLKKHLDNIILPLYFIKGNDYYYRKYAEKTFKSLTEGFATDFNLSYVSSLASWEDISIILNTPPVMSSYRVVFWSNDLRKSNTETMKNLDSGIKNYIKNPNITTILVIIDDGDYCKSLYKYGEIVDCSRLESSELMNFVSNSIVNKGYNIDNAVLKALINRCDCDMSKITNELEKLYSYCEDKLITADAVEDCVTVNTEMDIFKLTDAIGKNNTENAFLILRELLAKGEQPLTLLALITNQFKRMFYAKISNLTDEQLAVNLGVKSYSVKQAREIGKRFKPMELKKIVDTLQEIEFNCKQGKLGIEEGLQLAMCHVTDKRI